MSSTYNEEELKKLQDQSAQDVQKQNEQNLKTLDLNMKGLSDTTKQQLSALQQGYQQSDAVSAAQQYLQGLQQNKPQDYVSQYDADIQNAYNQLMNRPSFQYDLNADMLYQQYKDQYQTLGQKAMMDTMGQAAALTGGYGSSWASTAGQQAYQGYLQEMNNMIPELYDRAYNQYAMEGEALKDQYAMASDMENQAYGRWQDAYDRWASERAAAENTYNTERGFDYGQYSDKLNYWQNLAQAESEAYWAEREQAYSTAIAMIQAGKVPSDELLYFAGISAADLKTLQAMYKKKSGGGPVKPRDLITDLANAAKVDATHGASREEYYKALKGTSAATQEAASKLYESLRAKEVASQKGKTKKEEEYNKASYGW